MAFALNGVKEHMNLMAELRGYGDVMTMTMAQCRMQPENPQGAVGRGGGRPPQIPRLSLQEGQGARL